jgi:hypothetical protein
MVSSPRKYTVGVCDYIYHPLILCYVSSTLVTLPKVIDAHIRVSDTFGVTVSFKSIYSVFQVFLRFVPENRY